MKAKVLAAALLLGSSTFALAADPGIPTIVDSGLSGYISIGAVAMQRSDPEGGAIVASNPGLASFLSADAYDFGWQAGVDASMGLNFLTNETIEARFLYLDTDASSDFTTPGNFIGAGFIGPGGTIIGSDYETQLRNWEVNWRHRFSEQFTVLAGVRSIDIQDDLSYRISTVARSEYRYDNDLLGAQVGADWAAFSSSNPFQINIFGKIGVYSLDSEGGTQAFSTSSNTPLNSYRTDVSDTVYAGEIGVSADYRFTDNIKITGGYQLLWMSDVGLASNNAAYSLTNPTLLSQTVVTDSLYFHGFNLGLTVSW